MSAVAAPTVELTVTDSAIVEIKKFMTSEDDLPAVNADLGMTVFMNTHLLSEVAKVCTTIGVLNHGELVYKDSIEETTRRFPDEASLEDIYVRMGGATT